MVEVLSTSSGEIFQSDRHAMWPPVVRLYLIMNDHELVVWMYRDLTIGRIVIDGTHSTQVGK